MKFFCLHETKKNMNEIIKLMRVMRPSDNGKQSRLMRHKNFVIFVFFIVSRQNESDENTNQFSELFSVDFNYIFVWSLCHRHIAIFPISKANEKQYDSWIRRYYYFVKMIFLPFSCGWGSHEGARLSLRRFLMWFNLLNNDDFSF